MRNAFTESFVKAFQKKAKGKRIVICGSRKDKILCEHVVNSKLVFILLLV